MTKRSQADGWTGIAMFVGVPATLAMLVAAFPIGVIVLAATIGAFRHGQRLGHEIEMDEAAERSREAQKRREQALIPERERWQAEWEALEASHDLGNIDEDVYEERFHALVDSYPR